MKLLKDIPYRQGDSALCDTAGKSGLCDLYIPKEKLEENVAALVIHGGGWSGMAKENTEGIALWLCEELGLPVCNTNYRLCGDAPWPACGEDCLAAARFSLETTEFSASGNKGGRRLIVIGGSSGGHLALFTGLRLPPEQVACVISISGIADLPSDMEFSPRRYQCLFSHLPNEDELHDAAPATYLGQDSPPILCTHDWNDNVVPIRSAQLFLDAVHKNGTVGKAFFYIKPETGYSHRIWIPDSSPHKLYPEIENAISAFIQECLKTSAI